MEYAGTTENNGVKTEIAYDTPGRVASVSKLNGHEKTSYEYLIGPGANAIKMNTDYRTGEFMNLMQYLDGLGKETKLVRLNDGARLNEKTYDSFWRPVAEYNIGSGVTNLTYENSPLSKLLRTEDAVNNVVIQRYFGQPEADTVPFKNCKACSKTSKSVAKSPEISAGRIKGISAPNDFAICA